MNTQEPVAWFRDAKTKEKWYVPCDIDTTVGQLRMACERHPRYDTSPDRSPGFLTLSFNGELLADDSLSLSDLRYPEYTAAALVRSCIEVAVLPVKDFRLTFQTHGISCTIPCHQRVKASALKMRLGLRFEVSPRAIRLCQRGSALDDRTLLDLLPSQELSFSIEGHTRLSVVSAPRPASFFVESGATVLDFVSLIQAKLFGQNAGDGIRQISVLHGGQPLPDSAVIQEIFPSGAASIALVPGDSLSPDLLTLSFHFPSGPPCSLSLPSDSRMGFARTMISRLR